MSIPSVRSEVDDYPVRNKRRSLQEMNLIQIVLATVKLKARTVKFVLVSVSVKIIIPYWGCTLFIQKLILA